MERKKKERELRKKKEEEESLTLEQTKEQVSREVLKGCVLFYLGIQREGGRVK